MMRSVRQRDTKPELLVRSAAHGFGLRFRLHGKELPGRPDLVFPRWRIAIFVHGCFWHRHPGCTRPTTPSSNAEFWQQKFEANIVRDKRNVAELQALGWSVHILWECEVSTPEAARLAVARVFGISTCAGSR
jgi:DNA mismatch endonuclease (patch repair protein)